LARRPVKRLNAGLRLSHFQDLFPNMGGQDTDLTLRLAGRLKRLRGEHGLSLQELAARSGVSRATLSRLENAEVSPTAEALGRLCAAYGLPISRLMTMVEDDWRPHMKRGEQPVWTDPDAGFVRRSVSPPARGLAAEVIECELAAGAEIAYPSPPVAGLEHHLVMLNGALEIEHENAAWRLGPGDCLRYQLHGASAFRTPAGSGARYILVVV
jgi:transcriptional regulator with XRE-family HTH domain